MFTKTTELYDLIYSSIKDYRADAAAVAALLSRVAPNARSLLDVACGTGEHARHLSQEHGYVIQGLDIEPGFVELARAKVPSARFWQGDMASFQLDDRFDAVVCLFSSIGYLLTTADVTRALACFRRHLTRGGVVLVEPWLTPDVWKPGTVHFQSAKADGLSVTRMSHSGMVGHVSTIDFHYLVGTPEGIEHRTEHHELGLYSRTEMSECFARAGFERVDYDEKGIMGRGLYIASA